MRHLLLGMTIILRALASNIGSVGSPIVLLNNVYETEVILVRSASADAKAVGHCAAMGYSLRRACTIEKTFRRLPDR